LLTPVHWPNCLWSSASLTATSSWLILMDADEFALQRRGMGHAAHGAVLGGGSRCVASESSQAARGKSPRPPYHNRRRHGPQAAQVSATAPGTCLLARTATPGTISAVSSLPWQAGCPFKSWSG